MGGRRTQAGQRDLSPLELDIMSTIWQLGECTSAQVVEAYRKRRPLAATTIRTVMSNIRRKGYIEMMPSVEPRIRFRPTVSRRTVARGATQRLVATLFDDSPLAAVALILEDASLERADLDALDRLLDQHRGACDADA